HAGRPAEGHLPHQPETRRDVMSNPYLERLRGRAEEKRHPSQPSKPSEPGFEGFEGDRGCHFSEDEQPPSSKNTTTAYPQNLQNLGLPSEPTATYRAVSAEPDGTACRVEIVELPATGLRYRRTFA